MVADQGAGARLTWIDFIRRLAGMGARATTPQSPGLTTVKGDKRVDEEDAVKSFLDDVKPHLTAKELARMKRAMRSKS